jgi:oxidase EvaA
MKQEEIEKIFLASSLELNGYVSSDKIIDWINKRRNSIEVVINLIPFSKLNKWGFDEDTGNLCHESKRFFSIEGLEVKTNWKRNENWTQPIINQPEIGLLGIITKKINGVLHFLMQAKIEPGNINYIQISPTLQATKSNYSKVHQGKTPLYLEYFNEDKKVNVLLDQLQSEQGARFLKKRNRNIIVEVEDDIPVYDDFCWLTLGQIKELMRCDNLVNMDTRTVISGISFGEIDIKNINYLYGINNRDMILSRQKKELLENFLSKYSKEPIEHIISWLTKLKSKYELEAKQIPLNIVKDWIKTDNEIFHKQKKYFSVIAADIHISNREVINWSQPLIKSAQEGLIAFIIKKINGIYHFLVQAKIEAGNFDILEFAPTVQCLTGNYRVGYNEYEVPFINEVLNAPEKNIIYKAYQSEEGGRFYKEQNLNIIIEVDDNYILDKEIPENYCWMTLNQLFTFIKFNNYINIQARSLISAIMF